MAFNLSQFKNTLNDGGARPSLFEMEVSLPTAVRALPGANEGSNLFRFHCKVSQIPGQTLGVVEVPYFGRKLKFAGDRTFANLTVTIINDENFTVRKILERWQTTLGLHTQPISALTSPAGANVESYGGEGLVTQFGKTGNRLRRYKFYGMFPTNLAEIPLDWNTTDTIEEYTCEFAYQWWEVPGEII